MKIINKIKQKSYIIIFYTKYNRSSISHFVLKICMENGEKSQQSFKNSSQIMWFLRKFLQPKVVRRVVENRPFLQPAQCKTALENSQRVVFFTIPKCTFRFHRTYCQDTSACFQRIHQLVTNTRKFTEPWVTYQAVSSGKTME